MYIDFVQGGTEKKSINSPIFLHEPKQFETMFLPTKR